MSVTPSEAEDIFYTVYRSEPNWHEVGKPLAQQELRMKCWQAVIDAVRKEAETDLIAKSLLPAIERDAHA